MNKKLRRKILTNVKIIIIVIPMLMINIIVIIDKLNNGAEDNINT